jgi:hypothetical protein
MTGKSTITLQQGMWNELVDRSTTLCLDQKFSRMMVVHGRATATTFMRRHSFCMQQARFNFGDNQARFCLPHYDLKCRLACLRKGSINHIPQEIASAHKNKKGRPQQ